MIRLSNEVTDALKTLTIQGTSTTMPRMDRSLYEAVNKALVMMGGKWNRSARAHVWECDPNDPIADAIETGVVRDWRQDFQFFETPLGLAREMVEMADIQPGMSVLEPSAGKGAILRALPTAVILSRKVLAVELNPQVAQELAGFFPEVPVVTANFLETQMEDRFDRILMNPPFNSKNGGGRDIQHVRQAYRCLRPGGVLVGITSPGWEFRTDKSHSEFREWLQGLPLFVRDLAPGTFDGTGVRAKLIKLYRPSR